MNTCSFIQEATEESIATILRGRRGVAAPRTVSATRGRRLHAQPVRRRAHRASSRKSRRSCRWAEKPRSRRSSAGCSIRTCSPQPPAAARTATRTASGPSAYLQIADGCHRSCAYCIIPTIRGPYRSRPLDAIVAEASELVAGGAEEIILIGQDTTHYGSDLADGHHARRRRSRGGGGRWRRGGCG